MSVSYMLLLLRYSTEATVGAEVCAGGFILESSQIIVSETTFSGYVLSSRVTKESYIRMLHLCIGLRLYRLLL